MWRLLICHGRGDVCPRSVDGDLRSRHLKSGSCFGVVDVEQFVVVFALFVLTSVVVVDVSYDVSSSAIATGIESSVSGVLMVISRVGLVLVLAVAVLVLLSVLSCLLPFLV